MNVSYGAMVQRRPGDAWRMVEEKSEQGEETQSLPFAPLTPLPRGRESAFVLTGLADR